jgi:hypothetical protein
VSSVSNKQQVEKMSWRQIFIREFGTRYKTKEIKKNPACCAFAEASAGQDLPAGNQTEFSGSQAYLFSFYVFFLILMTQMINF